MKAESRFRKFHIHVCLYFWLSQVSVKKIHRSEVRITCKHIRVKTNGSGCVPGWVGIFAGSMIVISLLWSFVNCSILCELSLSEWSFHLEEEKSRQG